MMVSNLFLINFAALYMFSHSIKRYKPRISQSKIESFTFTIIPMVTWTASSESHMC